LIGFDTTPKAKKEGYEDKAYLERLQYQWQQGFFLY
jgi:hypothetical protein